MAKNKAVNMGGENSTNVTGKNSITESDFSSPAYNPKRDILSSDIPEKNSYEIGANIGITLDMPDMICRTPRPIYEDKKTTLLDKISKKIEKALGKLLEKPERLDTPENPESNLRIETIRGPHIPKEHRFIKNTPDDKLSQALSKGLSKTFEEMEMEIERELKKPAKDSSEPSI